MSLTLLLGLGLGGGYFVQNRTTKASEPVTQADEPQSESSTRVEVISPRPGGLDRVCVQPGTVEPFEAADLYAKVSGFLVEQPVDIGSRVNEGDVLARLAVPEQDKQVQKDTAEVRRAEAKVGQANAAIVTAEADLRSAGAAVALAQAELKSKASYRSYRRKQLDRVKGLFAERAIDAKLVDEQEDQHEAALAAELAAGEGINAAKQKEAAAKAKVDQARADKAYAESDVAVAKSQLEKTLILAEYSVVKSPYTGVITRRNFNRGDFIRSADAGGERTPLFSVERTDVMRVVLSVPDRDVPFTNCGDQATVQIDALPGVVFKTAGREPVAISRIAESEDTHSRTMRTEIDLKNAKGLLRRGMYGRVTLVLQPGDSHAVRIPSTALNGKPDGGKGKVRVVRDGHIQTVPVQLGADNGIDQEVLAGLTAGEQVVVRTTSPVDDGEPVSVADAKPASGGAIGH